MTTVDIETLDSLLKHCTAGELKTGHNYLLVAHRTVSAPQLVQMVKYLHNKFGVNTVVLQTDAPVQLFKVEKS